MEEVKAKVLQLIDEMFNIIEDYVKMESKAIDEVEKKKNKTTKAKKNTR